jgi:hypothetical protein
MRAAAPVPGQIRTATRVLLVCVLGAAGGVELEHYSQGTNRAGRRQRAVAIPHPAAMAASSTRIRHRDTATGSTVSTRTLTRLAWAIPIQTNSTSAPVEER